MFDLPPTLSIEVGNVGLGLAGLGFARHEHVGYGLHRLGLSGLDLS